MTKIGIIGGGQLGGLLMRELKSLSPSAELHVYSPKYPIIPQRFNNSEKLEINLVHHQGEFNDYKALKNFCQQCNIVTYELEAINIKALLDSAGNTRIVPDPKILQTIQDKLVQKRFLIENYFSTTPLLNNGDRAINNKYVRKARFGGYDGRGVEIVSDQSLVEFNPDTHYCEQYVQNPEEYAVIVGRNAMGHTFAFPSCLVHVNKNHQLHHMVCPSGLNCEDEQKLKHTALSLAQAFDLIGIIAVEFFRDHSGNFYINEISPRPHNTGHHSLEFKYINQYSLLARCILDMQLPQSVFNCLETNKEYHLVNILGNRDCILDAKKFSLNPLFADTDLSVWLYGKNQSFPGRKLGHVTMKIDIDIDNDSDELLLEHLDHSINLGISNRPRPQVAVIMGSSSDLPVMRGAIDILEYFGVAYIVEIVSAHRTPTKMFDFAKNAEHLGYKVIIAGAGGAAHLPGMVASETILPVIGVPVRSANSMIGLDSLLSIGQMPAGIPVATMAINGSANAGIMAVKILANHNLKLKQLLKHYQKCLKHKVEKQQQLIKSGN